MSYNTQYYIELPSSDSELELMKQEIDNLQYYGLPEFKGKWYEHDNDLKQFTADHDITVVLVGAGEETTFESIDIWRKTFKNGSLVKHEIAEIQWFNKSL